MKRLYIKTYGCQMNVYDSARMADLLTPLGYAMAETPEGADMVILNTCHIREKATEKVFSELGRLKTLKSARKEAGGRMILAVAGCVAQAEGAEILARAPQVDLVVGPQAYHRLPELVAKVARAGGQAIDTDFPVEAKFDFLPEASTPPGASAFLSVQEGCDKFCTFCVVPYTRGAEYSRPVGDILGEARRLVAAGAAEITFLGQNVNAYRGEGPRGGKWSLARLIRAAAGIEGLERIRYTTSHPRDLDEELIAAHGEVAQLMPFLHLPVQSGSDSILAAMNRQHSAEDYLDKIALLRRARPDIALSTDFIVGFPGENAADFSATLALAEEAGFAQAYAFKYCARPGTPAAAMPNQVPEEVKAERLELLQKLLAGQQERFNRSMLGRIVSVLFERPGRHAGQLAGRSPWLQAVHACAPADLIGRIAKVAVEGIEPHSLSGRLVEPNLPRQVPIVHEARMAH
ncbi:MAG TPA: tRNA (N6-isopentenyl adenosine(37)-C2)-methylthiotransferase MiaB [Alphaproteobacteria bacterium]|nr:tRNA (N6-isopentenyl adenosine(37)-C2)-methylthiotransferase MiaB [Alphaproteobacteria bacterium]